MELITTKASNLKRKKKDFGNTLPRNWIMESLADDEAHIPRPGFVVPIKKTPLSVATINNGGLGHKRRRD